jgi:hypothetical protein
MSPSTRRWTWTAALAGVGTAAAIPMLGLVAARTLGDSTAGQIDVPQSSLAPARAETPGALLVATDGNDVVGLTVFALRPTGAGGSVVIVPAGSEATIDGFDHPTRLANAYHAGGLDAEVTATEGLLGVTFSTSQEADQAGLVRLIRPLGPITVNLADPVLRTGANGRDEQVLPAGRQTITPEQAAAALFARRANESEILRIPVHTAIWNGIAQAAGRVAHRAPPASPPGEVAGYLAALGAGPRSARALDVNPALDVVTNPDAIDLLQVDNASTHLLMAELLPTAVSPTNGGLRVMLRNRTGQSRALYDATARLLFSGANIVAVDQVAGQTPTTGSTLSYDPSLTQDRIEGLTVAVGPAVASPARARIDGVDVTIELGQDFLTFLRQNVSGTGNVASTTVAGVETTTR